MRADEKRAWSKLEMIFTYFERLGVAVAVAGTGAAMMHFSKKLLEDFLVIPFLAGVLLLLCAFALVIFATAHFIRIVLPNVGKVGTFFAVAAAIGMSVLFLRTGILVASAALNPPAEQAKPKESVPPQAAPTRPSVGAAPAQPAQPATTQAPLGATSAKTPAANQQTAPPPSPATERSPERPQGTGQ